MYIVSMRATKNCDGVLLVVAKLLHIVLFRPMFGSITREKYISGTLRTIIELEKKK